MALSPDPPASRLGGQGKASHKIGIRDDDMSKISRTLKRFFLLLFCLAIGIAFAGYSFHNSHHDSPMPMSWAYPKDITDNIGLDGQEGDDPQVAMDDDNNVIIVRCWSVGRNGQIYMSEPSKYEGKKKNIWRIT
jgi:hypothetical protein